MTARTTRESAQLRERAIALRRAGKSVRQIKQILGPVGNRALHDALRGEPPPEWTRRPNAKDDLRARARELRRQGLDYDEIVGHLGVAKSSVSLWDTAGIPRSDLAFQLQIHETADVAAAIQFWLGVTAARPDQFRKVSLKQGNPRTTRKNTGDDYHGCLRVDVMRSCELYRKIEGWASAVTEGAEAPGCSGTIG